MAIYVTDPNWPLNNGAYDFPFPAIRGQEIEWNGKKLVIEETMTIRDERHLFELLLAQTSEKVLPLLYDLATNQTIDTSDIPEATEEFFRKAKLIMPAHDPRMRFTLKDMAKIFADDPKIAYPLSESRY